MTDRAPIVMRHTPPPTITNLPRHHVSPTRVVEQGNASGSHAALPNPINDISSYGVSENDVVRFFCALSHDKNLSIWPCNRLQPSEFTRAAVERGGAVTLRTASPRHSNDLRRLCAACGADEPAERLTLCRHCLHAA